MTDDGRGAVNRAKTHCPYGHPYDEENTYRPPSGGRFCRACGREAQRRWRQRNLAVARAKKREAERARRQRKKEDRRG